MTKYQHLQKAIREVIASLPEDERAEPSPEDVQKIEILFNAGAAWQRERVTEEKLRDVIRKWNYHWMLKEPGYETRARLCDSNMQHHLAELLKQAFDDTNPSETK